MGRFTIHKTATGYTFDLRAANGEVVAVSEVYRTRSACQKGILGVMKCAPAAPVADLTEEKRLPPNPRYEIFSGKSNSFRFRLRSRNGKIIASSQGYSTYGACLTGIESVRHNAAEQ